MAPDETRRLRRRDRGSCHASRRLAFSDRGLTLPELLIVITVLGVLAAVTIMSVAGATDSGNEAALEADADVIRTAQEVHYTQFGRYADEDELVEAGLVRKPSQLHDIVVEPDGRYRLVRADGTDPDAASDDGASDDADTSDGSTTTSQATTTTAVTTTAAPTTVAPTTIAPTTTAAPTTTSAPTTTAAPTTVMATTTVAPASTTTAPTTVAPTPAGDVTCTFTVTSAWNNGGNGSLEITNNGDRPLGSWTVSIGTDGLRIRLWSAAQQNGDPHVASDRGWNGSVAAGQTREVTGGGITGAGLSAGQTFPCDVISEAPDVTDVRCSFTVRQTWNSGGTGRLQIDNNGDTALAGWTIAIESGDVSISMSGTRTVSSTDSTLTVESESWAGSVRADSRSRTSANLTGTGLSRGQTFDCSVIEVY